MKPLITNIQRFSIHDGPGIRTTVFFKGCSMRCPWCANPENLAREAEYFFDAEKCAEACSRASVCSAKNGGEITREEAAQCNFGALGVFGKYYDSEALYAEIKKDAGFYAEQGGVTFSGGEALLFLPEYTDLLQRLRAEHITACVETSLMVPEQNCLWAARNLDYFYVDLKLLEPEKCRNILKGDVPLFRKNLDLLYSRVPRERLVYRVPLVPGITCEAENLAAVKALLRAYPPLHVEIFSVHNLGQAKYRRLGKSYEPFPKVAKEQLLAIQEDFMTTGVKTVINAL